MAQPRLAAHKPPGSDHSGLQPKTYPPQTTTRPASGIRLRLSHTSSCGRTGNKVRSHGTTTHIPYGSSEQPPTKTSKTRDVTPAIRSQVYHHASACSNTYYAPLASYPSSFIKYQAIRYSCNQHASWHQCIVSLVHSISGVSSYATTMSSKFYIFSHLGATMIKARGK
jgi:hypothetical protein